MNRKIIYPLIVVLFAGWFIKDDLPFLWMYLHKEDMVQTQGIVTSKYVKSTHGTRGGNNVPHYFIEVRDIGNACSGTSRISRKQYEDLTVGEQIPLLAYDTTCLAAFDIHMYAPPKMHFIPLLFFLAIALICLGVALKEFLSSRKK